MIVEIRGLGEKMLVMSPHNDTQVCIRILGTYRDTGVPKTRVDVETKVSAEELKACVDSVTKLCKKKK